MSHLMFIYISYIVGTFYLKNDRTETLPIFGYRFQDGQIAYVKINKLFSLNIVLSYIIKWQIIWFSKPSLRDNSNDVSHDNIVLLVDKISMYVIFRDTLIFSKQFMKKGRFWLVCQQFLFQNLPIKPWKIIKYILRWNSDFFYVK